MAGWCQSGSFPTDNAIISAPLVRNARFHRPLPSCGRRSQHLHRVRCLQPFETRPRPSLHLLGHWHLGPTASLLRNHFPTTTLLSMSVGQSKGIDPNSYFCMKQTARSHQFEASCERCSPDKRRPVGAYQWYRPIKLFNWALQITPVLENQNFCSDFVFVHFHFFFFFFLILNRFNHINMDLWGGSQKHCIHFLLLWSLCQILDPIVVPAVQKVCPLLHWTVIFAFWLAVFWKLLAYIY